MNQIPYLNNLNENIIDLGLDRIKKTLSLIGNIQNNFKIIHIAGTNGKGSTCQFINDILLKNTNNLKIGLFTSPHIEHINERIKINNKKITNKNLIKYINYFKKLLKLNKINLTYFEVLTVVAIKYFYDEKIDIAVIECGLGGRLDSTNVFENILASIITNISFDHKEYLGNTLKKILNEKMGIIKKNVPIITAISQKNLQKIISNKANELNSKIYILNKDFFIKKKAFLYNNFSINNLNLTLKGEHQYKNLAIALMTVQILKKYYTFNQNIHKTINRTQLDSRLEYISYKKNRLNTNIIFDVGHNNAGIKEFSRYIKTIKNNYKNIIIVFGALKEKDYKGMIKNLLEIGDIFYLTEPKSNRKIPHEFLLKEFYRHQQNKKVKLSHQNYISILEDIKKNFSSSDLICIVGSFYLVSEFKKNIKG